jgi:hypothetical protein
LHQRRNLSLYKGVIALSKIRKGDSHVGITDVQDVMALQDVMIYGGPSTQYNIIGSVAGRRIPHSGKHNVEDVGNFENFLPELYSKFNGQKALVN